MSEKWTEQKTILTVFYGGLYSSQTQLAKFTGNRGFIGTTSEHVICPNSCDLIKNPWINKEISEIELEKKEDPFRNPVKLISKYISKNYNESHYKITDKCSDAKCEHFAVTNNFTLDKTLKNHNVRLLGLNFGQNVDIIECISRIKSASEGKNDGLIMYGLSKGAATIFNTLSYLNRHYEESDGNINLISKVKLVVLDGCYNNLTENISKTYKASFFLNFAINSLTLYNKSGYSPNKSVNNFPSNIPIIFITSKKDTEVPMSQTITLAKSLANSTRGVVYLLILDNSTHSNCSIEDESDKLKYLLLLHNIYKKLDLPYIEKYANDSRAEQLEISCKLN
jgi:hypothetical protein